MKQMTETRVSKHPRPRPLTPQDVIKRVPRCPSDIHVSVAIPIPSLTKQKLGLKQKYIKLV